MVFKTIVVGSNPTFLVALIMWLFYSNLSNFLLKLIKHDQSIIKLVFLIINWFLVSLRLTKLEFMQTDENIVKYSYEKLIFFNSFTFCIDYIYLLYISNKNVFNSIGVSFSIATKTKQLFNNNFYKFNNNFFELKSFNQTINLGLISI